MKLINQVRIWILEEIFKVCQMQRISSLRIINLKFWLFNSGKKFNVDLGLKTYKLWSRCCSKDPPTLHPGILPNRPSGQIPAGSHMDINWFQQVCCYQILNKCVTVCLLELGYYRWFLKNMSLLWLSQMRGVIFNFSWDGTSTPYDIQTDATVTPNIKWSRISSREFN